MTSAPRNIAFMACPVEDFPALVRDLTQSGRGPWTLVCFYPPPVPLPAGMEVLTSRRAVTTAVRVWARSVVSGAEQLVICCHDLDLRSALQPIEELISACPAGTRTIVDVRGRRATVAAGGLVAVAALAVRPLLLLLADAVTGAGLALFSASPPRFRRPSEGRMAILLPVLPDLSHTFVYREVLALKRLHPEFLIVALERGDPTVVHGEAADLMAVTEFVPRLTAVQYLLTYLGTWARRPRAMASLIRFFQPHTAEFGPGARANDARCFLRLEYLQHSNYLNVGLMLAEFLRRRNVTYMHVYGSTIPSTRALIAHRLLGIPYSVSTYVDFDYWTPFHMLEAKFRPARFVVACTQFCATRLAERLPDLAAKFRVLHHALPPGYAAAPQFRASDGRTRLVYIGRFVPKKGLDTLVHACAILRESGVEVNCHIYGGGPEEEFLRRLAGELGLAEHVSFHPPVPNQHFYTTMNRDDVFVCPARYMGDGERDGIPVTLLEAMAGGITVVSTPVSGIPELIVDGTNGYLAPPDDPSGLARVLLAVVTEPARRAAVSAAARRTVSERFSLDNASTRLEDWISREIASPIETAEQVKVQAAGSV